MRVFDKLLRYCRRALAKLSGLDICKRRRSDPAVIDASVTVKPLVLDCDKSVFRMFAYIVDINEYFVAVVQHVIYRLTVDVSQRDRPRRRRKLCKVQIGRTQNIDARLDEQKHKADKERDNSHYDAYDQYRNLGGFFHFR